MDGDENPYILHEELGRHDARDVHHRARTTRGSTRCIAKIDELERSARSKSASPTIELARTRARSSCATSQNMLVIARVIAQGARNRDESRGAHFKPAFKERDDKKWLRTTLAFHEAGEGDRRSAIKYVRGLDYTLAGKSIHVTDARRHQPRQAARAQIREAGAASARRGETAKPPEEREPADARENAEVTVEREVQPQDPPPRRAASPADTPLGGVRRAVAAAA